MISEVEMEQRGSILVEICRRMAIDNIFVGFVPVCFVVFFPSSSNVPYLPTHLLGTYLPRYVYTYISAGAMMDDLDKDIGSVRLLAPDICHPQH